MTDLHGAGRRFPVEAVLVAAGRSRRMGGTDKLAALLAGRPVLRWSLEALVAGGAARIAIVTAPESVAGIAGLPWLPPQVVAIVAGGERRQESVAAGVGALGSEWAGPTEAAEPAEPAAGAEPEPAPGAGPGREPDEDPGRSDDPVVLVHDAARPLASPALVRAVAAAAAAHGAAIPVLPVAETLKRVEGGRIVATVDRTDLAAAQTPQGIRRSLLDRAYLAFPPEADPTFTDEAALLEACRIPVHAIDGEVSNIKLTVPADLERAEALVAARLGGSGAAGARVGFGTDSHSFGPGRPLALGGIRIEDAPALHGHSDGDVALHAVADALLGAAALGDLGRLFPAGAETPAGIDSRQLLAAVVERVRRAGYRPLAADVTIVAGRPRLAARLPDMAVSIAALLELPVAAVNVKASTGNLIGPEGGGRSATASAVVTIAPRPSLPGAPGDHEEDGR